MESSVESSKTEEQQLNDPTDVKKADEMPQDVKSSEVSETSVSEDDSKPRNPSEAQSSTDEEKKSVTSEGVSHVGISSAKEMEEKNISINYFAKECSESSEKSVDSSYSTVTEETATGCIQDNSEAFSAPSEVKADIREKTENDAIRSNRQPSEIAPEKKTETGIKRNICKYVKFSDMRDFTERINERLKVLSKQSAQLSIATEASNVAKENEKGSFDGNSQPSAAETKIGDSSSEEKEMESSEKAGNQSAGPRRVFTKNDIEEALISALKLDDVETDGVIGESKRTESEIKRIISNSVKYTDITPDILERIKEKMRVISEQSAQLSIRTEASNVVKENEKGFFDGNAQSSAAEAKIGDARSEEKEMESSEKAENQSAEPRKVFTMKDIEEALISVVKLDSDVETGGVIGVSESLSKSVPSITIMEANESETISKQTSAETIQGGMDSASDVDSIRQCPVHSRPDNCSESDQTPSTSSVERESVDTDSERRADFYVSSSELPTELRQRSSVIPESSNELQQQDNREESRRWYRSKEVQGALFLFSFAVAIIGFAVYHMAHNGSIPDEFEYVGLSATGIAGCIGVFSFVYYTFLEGISSERLPGYEQLPDIQPQNTDVESWSSETERAFRRQNAMSSSSCSEHHLEEQARGSSYDLNSELLNTFARIMSAPESSLGESIEMQSYTEKSPDSISTTSTYVVD